ncbi:hypothetical protein [Streptomyces coelicoflavus]
MLRVRRHISGTWNGHGSGAYYSVIDYGPHFYVPVPIFSLTVYY